MFHHQFHSISVDLSSKTRFHKIIAYLSLSIKLSPDCLINNARDSTYLRSDANGIIARNDFIGELLLDVVVPYELTMALAQQQPQSLNPL